MLNACKSINQKRIAAICSDSSSRLFRPMMSAEGINAEDVPATEVTVFNGVKYRISAKMLRNDHPSLGKVITSASAKAAAVAFVAFSSRSRWATAFAALSTWQGFNATLFTTMTIFACFGKSFSAKVHSRLLPVVMKKCDLQYSKIRQELLKNLSGTVLDFGAGGGAYLKYAFQDPGKVKKYVALEPNVHLHASISKEYNTLVEHVLALSPGASDQIPELIIVPKALDEYLSEVGGESFDWVIIGNVLCEVPQPWR